VQPNEALENKVGLGGMMTISTAILSRDRIPDPNCGMMVP
jgi:hypothetical protein